MSKAKCTDLIVRDDSAPTMQQSEEERRREREDLQRVQDRVWDERWTRVSVALLVATCVFTVVVLVDIARDRRGHPASADAEDVDPSSLSDATRPKEQRSFDFEDPSPISREMAIEHLYRYDGMADVRDDGYEEFDNWITGERVTTLGELRRFQVLLDMYGERRDRNADSDVPEDVRESVARHIRECKDRDNDNKDSND